MIMEDYLEESVLGSLKNILGGKKISKEITM
jgi:hypothetical protein